MWHIALAPATAPRFYLCSCNDDEIKRFKSLQDFYCVTFNLGRIMTKLLDLMENHPDVIVSIRVADLMQANEELIRRTKQELEQLITDANTETYPSAKKVAEMLDVDKSTLWRWAKIGYLVPINVGGKRRYRMSDVNRILNGEKQ